MPASVRYSNGATNATETMSVEELIQLMRTCSLADVRKVLETIKKKNPEAYTTIKAFYTLVALKKK